MAGTTRRGKNHIANFVSNMSRRCGGRSEAMDMWTAIASDRGAVRRALEYFWSRDPLPDQMIRTPSGLLDQPHGTVVVDATGYVYEYSSLNVWITPGSLDAEDPFLPARIIYTPPPVEFEELG